MSARTAIALSALAALAFAWILRTQLQRLYGLTAPSWDLGQSQQVLWSLAAGHGWSSSFENGRNFLGIHLELVFLPLAGVEWIWPSPVVPLVASALGLAATAPAAYLMLRALIPEQPASRWLALALAAPIPFWASTQEAARDQFHPENLALALAMLAAWAGLRGKLSLFWLLVVAVLSCKEDQVYTVVVIGLMVWRLGAPEMRVLGKVAIGFAAAWLVIGSAVQHLAAAGSSPPGAMYYWWIWREPGHNFFVAAISRPDPWVALAALLVSLLGLPLLAPRWLVLVLPPLLANLLSSHEAQARLQLHYVLIVMFPLIVAGGIGARRLLEQRRLPRWLPAPALLAGVAPALIIGLTVGRLPPALGAEPWLYDQPPAVDQLLKATAIIPAGAPVYADDGSAIWLANRPEIYLLYDAPQPDHYVVIDRQAWQHRDDHIAGRADAVALMTATGRRLLLDDGRFEVWSPERG